MQKLSRCWGGGVAVDGGSSEQEMCPLCSMAAQNLPRDVDPRDAKAGLVDGLLQDADSTQGKGPIPLRDFMEHLQLASADDVPPSILPYPPFMPLL